MRTEKTKKKLELILLVSALLVPFFGGIKWTSVKARQEMEKVVKIQLAPISAMMDFIIKKNGLEQEWIKHDKQNKEYEKSKKPIIDSN